MWRWRVEQGDCRHVMAMLPDGCVDSIVCDPPYSFGFMGKRWDTHGSGEDAAFGYWLAGFTDGEGCFRVQRHARGTFSCAFQMKLRRDDRAILEEIRDFIGAGTVRDADARGTSKPQATLVVQDKAGCLRVAELLSRYPLRAKKRADFILWTEAVWEWNHMPRGNRWSGPANWDRLAFLKERIESARAYREPSWSGHPFQDWCREWAEEALRVMKPGAHLIAFGGPRTYHRLAAGIEQAGFEIRDALTWLFGSGFPKSLNLDGGLGTALKPAAEFAVLARKPLAGTVAANVEAYGTGALNVDGCRLNGGKGVPHSPRHGPHGGAAGGIYGQFGAPPTDTAGWDPNAGRWPPNVAVDSEAARMVDAQSGEAGGGFGRAGGNVDRRETAHGVFLPNRGNVFVFGDTGGASRFFYCAKASRAERELGCEPLPARTGADAVEREAGSAGTESPRAGAGRTASHVRNHHPTVKPLDLMRWLVRLVTPPGGVVLDPFTGSGSTGMAAVLEGARFIGAEMEPEYVAIARHRIAHCAGWDGQEPPAQEPREREQLTLCL